MAERSVNSSRAVSRTPTLGVGAATEIIAENPFRETLVLHNKDSLTNYYTFDFGTPPSEVGEVVTEWHTINPSETKVFRIAPTAKIWGFSFNSANAITVIEG